jgi:hypothetical protein
MTIREVANRLATALHRDHSTLIQHYAVPHLEYTLQRELNSMALNEEGRDQETQNLL